MPDAHRMSAGNVAVLGLHLAMAPYGRTLLPVRLDLLVCALPPQDMSWGSAKLLVHAGHVCVGHQESSRGAAGTQQS